MIILLTELCVISIFFDDQRFVVVLHCSVSEIGGENSREDTGLPNLSPFPQFCGGVCFCILKNSNFAGVHSEIHGVT